MDKYFCAKCHILIQHFNEKYTMEKNYTKTFKQILPRSEHITQIFQQEFYGEKKWKISVVI